MKTNQIFALNLGLMGLAGASALGEMAASMRAGEWRELQTNGLNASLLQPTGGQVSDITAYGAKGAWDEATEQFFFLGSAHNFPNRFVSYSAATNSWKQEPLPDPCFNIGHTSGGCSVHSYYYAGGCADGKFYTYTGNSRIYQYEIEKGNWSVLNGKTIPKYGPVFGSFSYFPERDDFLYASGNVGLWQSDKGDATWKEISGDFNMGYYSAYATYNPVHRAVFFGGGGGEKSVNRFEADGTVSSMQASPIGLGTCAANVVADPVSGDLLALSESAFLKFDPVKNNWNAITSSPPPEVKKVAACNIASVAIPNHGVILYLTGYSAKVYLYKHAEGGAVKLVGKSHRDKARFSKSTPIGFNKWGYPWSAFDALGRLKLSSPSTTRIPLLELTRE